MCLLYAYHPEQG